MLFIDFYWELSILEDFVFIEINSLFRYKVRCWIIYRIVVFILILLCSVFYKEMGIRSLDIKE